MTTQADTQASNGEEDRGHNQVSFLTYPLVTPRKSGASANGLIDHCTHQDIAGFGCCIGRRPMRVSPEGQQIWEKRLWKDPVYVQPSYRTRANKTSVADAIYMDGDLFGGLDPTLAARSPSVNWPAPQDGCRYRIDPDSDSLGNLKSEISFGLSCWYSNLLQEPSTQKIQTSLKSVCWKNQLYFAGVCASS